MRHALLVTGLLGVALTGCAGKPSYSETLKPWIGASANALARVWGPPHAERLDANGKRNVTYVKSRVYTVPLGTSDQRETIRFTCKTSFRFSQDDAVEHIGWAGQVCGGGGISM